MIEKLKKKIFAQGWQEKKLGHFVFNVLYRFYYCRYYVKAVFWSLIIAVLDIVYTISFQSKTMFINYEAQVKARYLMYWGFRGWHKQECASFVFSPGRFDGESFLKKALSERNEKKWLKNQARARKKVEEYAVRNRFVDGLQDLKGLDGLMSSRELSRRIY